MRDIFNLVQGKVAYFTKTVTMGAAGTMKKAKNVTFTVHTESVSLNLEKDWYAISLNFLKKINLRNSFQWRQ